jgi:hypothetical protein
MTTYGIDPPDTCYDRRCSLAGTDHTEDQCIATKPRTGDDQ